MASSELERDSELELKAEDNEDTGELIDDQPVKTEVDLDLYADVEANEFASNNNQTQQQNAETLDEQNPSQIEVDLNIPDDGVIDDTGLYDDVMAEPNPNTSADFTSDTDKSKALGDSGHQNGKRVSCYVGNLSWWTTDKCLTEAIHLLGCADIIDIKFYENKVNGQSKGFALVTLGSEHSFRTVME
ncbi:cleavage and polyadenylation specificity factor subunit 6-like, partial [Brachionus plicatilis]